MALGILLWNELTFVLLGISLYTGECPCEVPHANGLLWAQRWPYHLSPKIQLFQCAVSTSGSMDKRVRAWQGHMNLPNATICSLGRVRARGSFSVLSNSIHFYFREFLSSSFSHRPRQEQINLRIALQRIDMKNSWKQKEKASQLSSGSIPPWCSCKEALSQHAESLPQLWVC